MRLASHIAKRDVWQMLLAGGIVELSVCRMGPDGNIAKRQVGTCGWQQPFGKSFLSCAQPENNSNPGQQTGRARQAKPRKPSATQQTQNSANHGRPRCSMACRPHCKAQCLANVAREKHCETMCVGGCSLQKTCRNIVLGECGLQGASPNPRCLSAQPEHDSKPSQPCCTQGFQRLSQIQLPGRAGGQSPNTQEVKSERVSRCERRASKPPRRTQSLQDLIKSAASRVFGECGLERTSRNTVFSGCALQDAWQNHVFCKWPFKRQ